MAFTDPIEFDPTGTGTTPLALPRVSTGKDTSTYTAPDGTISVKADHNYGRRTRRVIRVDTNMITPDPFIPANNVKVSGSVYTVFDMPVAGYSIDTIKGLYKGLNLLLEDDSDKILIALLGGQS